jgi:hypothetical protein
MGLGIISGMRRGMSQSGGNDDPFGLINDHSGHGALLAFCWRVWSSYRKRRTLAFRKIDTANGGGSEERNRSSSCREWLQQAAGLQQIDLILLVQKKSARDRLADFSYYPIQQTCQPQNTIFKKVFPMS